MGLADRWAGHRWDTLGSDFPGELESYLSDPMDLSFTPEPLDDVADRVCTVVRRLEESHPHGDVVVVSHQDPIQAARLRLTGRRLTSFHDDKPAPAGVITLRPGAAWTEETSWAPDESPRGDGSQLRLITVDKRDDEPPDTA
jgi:broad specificity phosphatase PhoE